MADDKIRRAEGGATGGIRHWQRGLADGGLEVFVKWGARTLHVLATPARDAVVVRDLWAKKVGIKLPDPEIRAPRAASRQIRGKTPA